MFNQPHAEHRDLKALGALDHLADYLGRHIAASVTGLGSDVKFVSRINSTPTFK